MALERMKVSFQRFKHRLGHLGRDSNRGHALNDCLLLGDVDLDLGQMPVDLEKMSLSVVHGADFAAPSGTKGDPHCNRVLTAFADAECNHSAQRACNA